MFGSLKEIQGQFSDLFFNASALSEEEKEEMTKSIRLDRRVFTNGKINIEGMPVRVPLPTVEIKDIRTADGTGVTVRNVLVQVVESLRR